MLLCLEELRQKFLVGRNSRQRQRLKPSISTTAWEFSDIKESEELLQRIEQCRQELIEAGENPDDYFKPVEPQMAAVYYFPNGLH